MAITTFAELQTAVGNRMNRTDLNSLIPEFIDSCESRLNRVLRHPRMVTVNASYSISSRYTNLPTDFSSIVTKVPSDADFVFFGTQQPPKAQTFAQQLLEQGKKAKLFSGDGANNPAEFKVAGSYVSNFAGPIDGIAYNKALIDGWKKDNPSSQLGSFGPPTYGAVQVALNAIKLACASKKGKIDRIDVVRVRNVKTVEKVTFRHKADALEIDACIAEGSAGVVSSSVLAEALDGEITKQAQAAMIAAREKRAITGPEGMTLELSGLRVIQPTPGDEQDLRPFGYDGGTTLALTLRRGAGGITAFDSEHSTIRSAVDDQGKDLTQPDDPTSSSSGGFGAFHFARRRAISASGTSRFRVRRATSSSIQSPSFTSASRPPAASSGTMCRITVP